MLGTGNFSIVSLVRRPKTGECFALKTIPKANAVREKVTEKLMTEKAALQAAHAHPLCLQMTATFQDTDFLYLLTEAADGGDLMSLMLEQDRFSPADSCFYAGCIAAAIAHVHKHGFAHRDVKPENCLISADGYVKLADFGLSKVLPFEMSLADGSSVMCELCYTMCGTPEVRARI